MAAAAEKLEAARDKALTGALKDIEKTHGAGSVMSFSQGTVEPIEVIRTGSLKLDRALGVGGLPKGRLIEIFGPEMSGKTTLALHAIAEVQRAGGRAVFIDAEHALDIRYAEALGVNVRELLIAQPDHGEQAIDISERLIRSGAVDVVVIDSVAALIPKAELEGGIDAAQMGLHARLMSKACRMLAGITQQTNATVIFINQIRMKIGVVYGNPEVTTGGNALKFYASVRIDIRRTGKLTHEEKVVGNLTRAKVVKNKVAPPFQQAEFDVVFGKGIWRPAELLDLGIEAGIITKKGAWYSIGTEQLGQGKNIACLALEKDGPRIEKIEAAVRAHLGLGGSCGEVEKGVSDGELPLEALDEDALQGGEPRSEDELLAPLTSGTQG
ncbi:MAG: recombinase RecA [Gammaproteobacteria bacterium]|nr:MAG: recombinase RecA [Gammaproteobacteria bacterium]